MKISVSSLICWLTISVPSAFAKDIDFSMEGVQRSETREVIFKPSPSHHFNAKAPSRLEWESEGKRKPLTFQMEAEKVTLSLNGVSGEGILSAELYLCDNENTYCVPKSKSISGSELKKTGPLIAIESTGAQKSSESPKAKTEGLFIVNDPETALNLARKEGKPLLIDFFGVWCPPCNILDETVFSTKEFSQYKSKFVYLKLDADHSISWDLKAKFNVKGYPTVVITTPNNEEILRIVGSRSASSFIAEMKKAWARKDQSLKQRTEKAEAGSTTEAWELGEMYFRQENYLQAHRFFILASKSKTLTSQQKDFLSFSPLLVAMDSKDAETTKSLIPALKASLETFPGEESFYEKLSRLKTIADELNDTELQKWVSEKTLQIADQFLKNPTLLKNSEITEADLWSLKADAFESLKKEKESKEAYSQVAKAYLKMIKKDRLSLESSRGYNIERIYAIYKSGNFDEAHGLYESMEKLYPEEFTFYYNHGQVLKEMKKVESALEKARQAYKFSYGDNRLRAAHLVAELENDLGRKKSALQVIHETLENFTLPSSEKVRTHRYVSRLKKLEEKINGKADSTTN